MTVTHKIRPQQRQLMAQYVGSLSFATHPPQIYTPEIEPLREMVMTLPWCGDLSQWDVYVILINTTFAFLEDFSDVERLKPAALEADHAKLLTDRLCGAFEELPLTYVLHISMPNLSRYGGFAHEITADISIDSITEVSHASKSVNKLAVALLAREKEQIVSSVLKIKCRGFASSNIDSPAVAQAFAIAKQCVFLFQESGAMIAEYKTDATSQCWIVQEGSTEKVAIEMPLPLSRLFGRLDFNVSNMVFWDTASGRSLLGSARPPRNDEEAIVCMDELFRLTSKFFSSTDHTDSDRIVSAIEWYEDSVLNQDQTIAFISACIGLESILGDRDFMTDMTPRLADRFAFLLGKDRDDRKTLSSQFKKIFNTRGELVHARKTRLTSRRQEELNQARRMLKDCIWKELQPIFKATVT